MDRPNVSEVSINGDDRHVQSGQEVNALGILESHPSAVVSGEGAAFQGQDQIRKQTCVCHPSEPLLRHAAERCQCQLLFVGHALERILLKSGPLRIEAHALITAR